MKVLMQNRQKALTHKGGDTVQMLKTKEGLERLGIEVDISLEAEPDLTGYDLVHVFNIQTIAAEYGYRQVINAKKQNVPVLLSPIYWDWDDREVYRFRAENGTAGRRRNPVALVNGAIEKLLGVRIRKKSSLSEDCKELNKDLAIRHYQKTALMLVDGLLPNARQEMELLVKKFGVRFTNVTVVPNAVDVNFKGSVKPVLKSEVRDYVLCAGRVEPNKNQLNLIKALKGLDIPLVFVGDTKCPDFGYVDLCRKTAGKKARFIDEVSHEELQGYYQGARVHALPSWRETPGLVNLEAGLAGCNLVVTNRGTTQEYFGEWAWYCDPADLDSIRSAVLAAYNAPRKEGLKEYIAGKYTWEKAAEATLDAYESVLETVR